MIRYAHSSSRTAIKNDTIDNSFLLAGFRISYRRGLELDSEPDEEATDTELRRMQPDASLLARQHDHSLWKNGDWYEGFSLISEEMIWCSGVGVLFVSGWASVEF